MALDKMATRTNLNAVFDATSVDLSPQQLKEMFRSLFHHFGSTKYKITVPFS